MTDAYARFAGIVREALPAQPDGSRPLLVGISGAVGVGKSTTAGLVRHRLSNVGVSAAVVCTDGFLLPNDKLAARGLSMRKGFPESYDTDLLASVLSRLRAGEIGVGVPAYSHSIYDRLPPPWPTVEASQVLIVEGVNALQQPPVDLLDLALYVDAEDDVLLDWFVARFLRLCVDAEAGDEPSFYEAFVGMSVEQREALARATWDGINLVNLRDHIAPSRSRASYVLRKAADHSVVELVPV